jgi:hypothetical protein
MPLTRFRGDMLRGNDGKIYRLLNYLSHKDKDKMKICNQQQGFSTGVNLSDIH